MVTDLTTFFLKQSKHKLEWAVSSDYYLTLFIQDFKKEVIRGVWYYPYEIRKFIEIALLVGLYNK